MRLETERLVLRQWRHEDVEAYCALQGDPVVRRYFPAPRTREEAAQDLDLAIAAYDENGFHFLAAEVKTTGELAGLIGLGRVPESKKAAIPSHPDIEIGWVLHHRYWGQGLAPEGARACLAYAWETLKAPEIVSLTSEVNRPSQRVMEKLGMVRDRSDDFSNPGIPEGHRLRPHILYRIASPS